MEVINRSWEKRYQIIKKIENYQSLPFSEKINIEQYEAKDNLLKQNVILKIIKINENPDIKNLARYLWHYEIALNRRATNNSRGKTLLKLVDAQIDEDSGNFILVTESGGTNLRELLQEEYECEDKISFNSFRHGNKKRIWESILKLIEGLYSLHISGLIHRNISIDSIYFDGEAYRQGEIEVLKLGDFNWSIYLHSLSNIFSNEIAAEIVKNNYHFFRAPECLPFLSNHDKEYTGETHQSDLYSLGLVLVFILEDFNYDNYVNSKIKNRNTRHQEIQEIVENHKGLPLEKEILSKLIEPEIPDRYSNITELLEKVQE